jgi:hypothetical protein
MKDHCNKCGTKKSCGLHHVYVIELDNIVLRKDKRFAPEFTDRSNTTVKCYYVGQTTHRPECRYNQHVAKRARPRKHFKCFCKTGKPELTAFTAFNRGNRATHKYHLKGGLRPRLFTHLNPVRGGRTAAEEAESTLANSLRAEGHAVHYN